MFDDDDEVQEEVMTWFKGQVADFYDSGIQKLVPRLNKYLDNAGVYIEKWSCVQGNFMFAPCINSIKNTFIVPSDAHYYKIREMLKQF